MHCAIINAIMQNKVDYHPNSETMNEKQDMKKCTQMQKIC